MKKIVNIFPRDTFFSLNNGNTKSYFHNANLFELLGSAKSIKLHWIGHSSSKDTTQVTIRAFQSSYPDRRPFETSIEIALSGNAFTALRPPVINIPPSFMGLVDVVVEVDDSAATGREEVQVEGELWATLIFEE